MPVSPVAAASVEPGQEQPFASDREGSKRVGGVAGNVFVVAVVNDIRLGGLLLPQSSMSPSSSSSSSCDIAPSNLLPAIVTRSSACSHSLLTNFMSAMFAFKFAALFLLSSSSFFAFCFMLFVGFVLLPPPCALAVSLIPS